ncbi:hypothetical protein ABB10_01090 [Bacillus thuringiensis]|nr:hypothetical protein [Bacillus thuringiensis]MBG9668657.1 hypothetical protein [Bacillus thuringiensis]MBH0350878.1 hypothetical protein [Bacillus thuringiensis]
MIPTFWILKVPQTLRFFVALRIQPHFHPIPKGDGLSRSGRAVNGFMFFQTLQRNQYWQVQFVLLFSLST